VYLEEPIGRWYRNPLSARSGGPPAGGAEGDEWSNPSGGNDADHAAAE